MPNAQATARSTTRRTGPQAPRRAARAPVLRPSRIALETLSLPVVRQRAGRDFAEAFAQSPQVGRRLVLTRLQNPQASDEERVAEAQELVQWGAASGERAQRRELVGAFVEARAELLLVHEISQLPAEQVAPFLQDYFEAGGAPGPVLLWLRMAGATLRGRRHDVAVATPRSTRTRSARGARATARGWNPIKAIGQGLDRIGKAVGQAVETVGDAFVKAGKTVAQAVDEAVDWTVDELGDLVTALVQAGRSLGEILAAAAAKSLDLLKQYVAAMLEAGRSIGELVLWAAGQAADRVTAVVSRLIALGRTLVDIVKPVLAAGRDALIAVVRAVLAAGKTLGALLLAFAAEALPVVQPLIDALLALGHTLKSLLTEGAKLAATACRTIVSALLNLGRSLNTLLLEAAGAVGQTLQALVQALLALGRDLGQLLAAVAGAAATVVKALVGVLLALGRKLGELVLAAVARSVACARALFQALLQLGHKVVDILKTLAGRGLSALRTALEGLLAMGTTLAALVKDICAGVAEGFRRGFFEGLVALGHAPLQIMKAAAEAGASTALLAFAVILEMFGGYRPLSREEREEAQFIFGQSIDLDRVQLGFAKLPGALIDYVNLEIPRAFTTMYLLNFGPGAKVRMSTVIHELAHVWQGVQQGPLYMTRALEAQIGEGVKSFFHHGHYDDSAAYEVTEAELRAHAGDFSKFNPEEQAQIVEDYWRAVRGGESIDLPLDLLEPYARTVFTAARPRRAASLPRKAPRRAAGAVRPSP